MQTSNNFQDKINIMILKETEHLDWLEQQKQNTNVEQMIKESKDFLDFLNDPTTDWNHYLKTKNVY